MVGPDVPVNDGTEYVPWASELPSESNKTHDKS
jgi:hypothetical protein